MLLVLPLDLTDWGPERVPSSSMGSGSSQEVLPVTHSSRRLIQVLSLPQEVSLILGLPTPTKGSDLFRRRPVGLFG